MEFFDFSDKTSLDNFVSTNSGEFLQSWNWGESDSLKVRRLGVRDGGQILAAVSYFRRFLPGFSYYLYSPRGPIFATTLNDKERQEIMFALAEELRRRENQAVFWRLEPDKLSKEVQESLLLNKSLDIQPAKTIFLDLEKSEEELLGEMHQKCRYNIRLAEKKGVIVKQVSTDNFFDFWKLLETTSQRDSFSIHPRRHYEKMLSFPGNQVRLYLAYQGEKLLAGGLFSFFGDRVTYMHGASSNENRELMAPYLLQWTLVREAKKEVYKYYDFYGIDENKWPGVTRFKRAFGGQEVYYPGTFDAIFRPSAFLFYNTLRRLRRFCRF